MVLPVGDYNPTRRTPWVTVALIAVNVGVFLLLQPHGGCRGNAFLFEWAAVPRELLSLQPLPDRALAQLLGPECAATVTAKPPVLVSAVTAMFLHANIAHLISNLLFLWVFGNNIEDTLGHLPYLAFYLLGGLAATFVFALLNADTVLPLLGASGAVAAVLGAYLVLYPRALVHTYVPFPLYLLAGLVPTARIRGFFLFFAIVSFPAWLVLVGWFGLQFVSASSPAAGGVAYAAHVTGFAGGAAVVLLLDLWRRTTSSGGLPRPGYRPGGRFRGRRGRRRR